MDLDDLIAQVEGDAPLDRLAGAMAVKADLDELADSLIGHFVDEARRAGCSWSEIGTAMGVSKQAAQQRHTSSVGRRPRDWSWRRFGRWTQRARVVVREAYRAAGDLGHDQIDTEHLLLGMLAVPGGIAGKLLLNAGVTPDRVTNRLALPAETHRRRRHITFAPNAKRLIEAAHANAVRLGHNYIGTEHQLLAAFDVPDSVAAEVLAAAGMKKDDVEAQVRTILHGVA